MTPCKELGYEVGDVFEVVSRESHSLFKNGDWIVLTRDDGTPSPGFQLISSPSRFKISNVLKEFSIPWHPNVNMEFYHYLSLNNVQKIYSRDEVFEIAGTSYGT